MQRWLLAARGLTFKVDSGEAKARRHLGVEVVSTGLDDLERLKKALRCWSQASAEFLPVAPKLDGTGTPFMDGKGSTM